MHMVVWRSSSLYFKYHPEPRRAHLVLLGIDLGTPIIYTNYGLLYARAFLKVDLRALE